MDANIYAFFRHQYAYRVLFLRFSTGMFIHYDVQDNVCSLPRMLEFRDFLQERSLPFLLLAGGAVRLVGLLLIINFTAAIFIAHLGQSFPQYYPAAQLIAVGFSFCFLGAGPASLNSYIDRTCKRQDSQLAANRLFLTKFDSCS